MESPHKLPIRLTKMTRNVTRKICLQGLAFPEEGSHALFELSRPVERTI